MVGVKARECWHSIKEAFQPTIPDSQGQISQVIEFGLLLGVVIEVNSNVPMLELGR